MSDLVYEELASLAELCARQAGELVKSMRESAIANPSTKSSSADLVTEADSAAERLILETLLADRPEDSVFGEEGNEVSGTSEVRWLIDPIDGTTNYVFGVRAYTISIAAEVAGEIVAGVVYDPSSDIMYRSTLGGGSSANGSPIRVRSPLDLATSLLATGFSYQPENRARQARILTTVLPAVRDIRRSGSAALDLCLVAEGIVDAYYESGLNLWDFAAGWLIAREAGALVTDLADGPPSPTLLVASAPQIADDLKALLTTASEHS